MQLHTIMYKKILNVKNISLKCIMLYNILHIKDARGCFSHENTIFKLLPQLYNSNMVKEI